MDIDKLLHCNALHNKILQSLNFNGLCKYDSLHKAYIFEQPDNLVNCSHILIFLKKTLTCNTITPDTHQWYRISTHEITDSHNITICNDRTVKMEQLPSAESNEANAIETFPRLSTTNSETKVHQQTKRQTINKSHNDHECNTSSNNIL